MKFTAKVITSNKQKKEIVIDAEDKKAAISSLRKQYWKADKRLIYPSTTII